MLLDTHAHLQVRQFDGDRDAVLRAALAGGVTRMIVPGIEPETNERAVALAREHPGTVFAAVGTHPHDAETLTDATLARQRELAREPGVVAIGEIGLDYYRDLSPRDVQRHALVAQIALARDLGLPIILHNRESHDDMVALLREHAEGVGGVFHCFIGTREMARQALDLGFYLSFAGPLTYPRNQELREVAAWAPEDRLLVETDCPYLAPQSVRGKRNEPRHVAEVARMLAQVRGWTEHEAADRTARNAATLFRLPETTPEPATEPESSND